MDNAGKKPVWSVQPPKGMLKGDYYRIEERFPPYYPGVEGEFPADPGHLGIVEAVKADGKLIFVELNEITAPSYYNHLYQGISKRRSSYSFWQYTKPRMQKAGSVLTMGMQYVEQQMLEKQSLSGDFDLVASASGSVKKLLTFAAKLDKELDEPSSKKLYSYSEDYGYGLTGWLKVVVENGNGSGTYKEGQNVTVSCDLFNEQGEKFDHWEVKSNTEGVKDKKVNVSSKKKTEINLIVEKCDCTLTAVYTKAEGSVGSVAVLKADKSATDKVYDNTVGEKVWVTAPAAAQGMVFDHWESTGNAENIENAKEKSTNVTVEENPVVLTPVYVVSTDPTFAVTVENGTGSGYYLPGDTVHITANVPKDGYYFDHWTNSDKDGNSAGLALESEYYYDTTFEMVDRYASIAESMIDKGDKALFAGGCDKSASLYTAKDAFDLSDVTVIGSGFNEEGAAYSVVKEYGTAAAACLKDFKGASIYNAGCANKAITCNLPDGEKKEELQKKLDAVYTQLGDGTIQPMAAAPGADVRKTFASNCLTLHYWILQSVKVSK